MSLYGRTDSNADVAKAGIGIAASSQAKTIVFVDDTEAALSENKLRGINAPGWWSYYTYTDCEGRTRHKCEHLVTLANPEANADETQADDTTAADVTSTITITTQPTNQTTSQGDATFTVVAAATVGSVTFQWQRRTTTGGRFTNVSGATSASLVLAGQTASANGHEYRVKLNSTAGATEVISNEVTLTFGT